MGGKTNISIENLAKKIIKIINPNIKIQQNKNLFRPKLSEVQNLKCNNSKILKYTKWKPSIELNEGLKKTTNWIRSHRSQYSNKYKI